MRRALVRLALVAPVVGLLGACKGDRVPKVSVKADSTTMESGHTTAVAATVTRNNNPVPDIDVTFTPDGCGTMSKTTVPMPSLGAMTAGTAGEAASSFTGDSPDATCVATIKAVAGSGTDQTAVTITPKPRVATAMTGGAGTTAAASAGYTVELIPNVLQVSTGFRATYTITSSGGASNTISRIAVTLLETGSVTTTNTKTNAHSSALVGKDVVVEEKATPNPTTEVLTITSDKTKLGTATIDVILNSGIGSHVDHATFPGVPGPKG